MKKLLSLLAFAALSPGCSCEPECYESAQPVGAWWASNCVNGSTVELINNGHDYVCRCKAVTR